VDFLIPESVLRPFNKFKILILYYYTEGIEIKNVFRLLLDVYNTCKFFGQKELLVWGPRNRIDIRDILSFFGKYYW
jgi:hypothetical protein